jgi:hypothetical protein
VTMFAGSPGESSPRKAPREGFVKRFDWLPRLRYRLGPTAQSKQNGLLFWKWSSPWGGRFFCLEGVAGEPSSCKSVKLACKSWPDRAGMNLAQGDSVRTPRILPEFSRLPPTDHHSPFAASYADCLLGCFLSVGDGVPVARQLRLHPHPVLMIGLSRQHAGRVVMAGWCYRGSVGLPAVHDRKSAAALQLQRVSMSRTRASLGQVS